MKPAFSVLFFTVCAGAGSGMLVWLLLMQLIHGLDLGVNWRFGSSRNIQIEASQLLVGGFIGLALVTLGLLSSTLHLANPKNAWRAFNRFRTSWLSREGVFSVLFYPLVLAYALVVYLNDWQLNFLSILLAIGSILIALATVYCTGMIYASLKPIRQWHNGWTTPIYLLLSIMSGSLLMLGLQLALYDSISQAMWGCYLVFAVTSGLVKWCYFVHIGKPDGATINTATGLGHAGASQASVRLLDAGHSADTFLTNEFGYDAGALNLLKLRRLTAVLAFMMPVALVLLAQFASLPVLIYIAIISVFAGLLVERWLFFAEARHVVRLYHGDQRT